MKNFFIMLTSFVVGFCALLYLTFLIIPSFINLDKYKPEIQKLVLENSKLNLEYDSLKVYTTPLLSVGVIADNLNLKLPDETSIIKTSKIKAGIALPSLLTLTVKTANCYVEKPEINLEIVDGKQYKIVKLIEEIINENNSKPKEELPPENQPIDVVKLISENKIKIKIPSLKISDYSINVTDNKSVHNLILKGEKLNLGYNSKYSVVKAKTIAELLSDNNVNVNADIDIITSVPRITVAKEETDPEEKIELPFINLIEIYQKYDFKADIVSKLCLKETKNRGLVARGFLNIDNIKLKLSNVILPESYIHTKFHGKTVEYDTDLYATKEEKLSVDGILKFGKHPSILAQIVSEKIQFKNLLSLLKGLFDSLNIKNNFASINATGYLEANASVKTDFKKLKSFGSIYIKDGSFVNPKIGIGIKDIQANLAFDNDALNIKDTSAIINNSKLNVSGYIDNNSNADVKLNINNLSIPSLYSAFAPKEIKKELLLNSAILSASVDIKGKLNSLDAKLKTKLTELNLSDKKKTMFVSNSNADMEFNVNSENIKGKIKDSGFIFNIPQSKTNLKISSAIIDVDNEQITLSPFDIVYNDMSKINLKGKITNYLKEPDIDVLASGSILTSNIKQSLGREVSYYLNSKGSIPVKVKVTGNTKKQDILAQIYTDSNNFITPVDIKELASSPCIFQADVKLAGNKIKIKNSGLFKKASVGFSDNLLDNMTGSSQIAEFTTTIDNGHINLLRLNLPNELNGNISVFKKSSFKTKGKITLNGFFDSLNFGGGLKIWNVNIPELKTKVSDIDLTLNSNSLNLLAKEVNLNGSKLDTSFKTSLTPSSVIALQDFNLNSDLIDVDKTMVVLDDLNKYMPPAAPAKGKGSSQSADIPLNLSGKFNIKEIKTGNIKINNSKGNLNIKNNNLYIDKLSAKAFSGDITGNITVNLITQLIGAKLKGKNVNADKLLVDCANMKDTISGTAEFVTDITLKGATYIEQVKSLKGTVKFHLKDGVYGPFSKLENFFLAENIRNNPVFANTIGVILSPLTTINSSKYENLDGTLTFKDGIAYLDSIGSQGEILCVLIKGQMNLITNEIESNVRVRLASAISDLLGPLAVANPVNLVKKTPGLNVVTAKLFKIFTSVVTESEYKEIPDFSAKHSDSNATKFQIVLKGDVSKPVKLVKSFKWLALQADMDKAEEFSTAYVKEQEDLAKQELINKLQKQYEDNNKLKVGVEKVLQMDTTAPAVKKVLVQEVIKSTQTARTGTSTNEEALNEAKKELKEQIKDAANKKAQEKAIELNQKLKEKAEAKIKAKQEAKQKASNENAKNTVSKDNSNTETKAVETKTEEPVTEKQEADIKTEE